MAAELAAKLAAQGGRALLIGIGSGRNVRPLLAAGVRVYAADDDPGRVRAATSRFGSDARVSIVCCAYVGPYPFAGSFDGALSTHALLHGTPRHVAAAVAAVRARLNADAPFYFTLGSKRDPRYGAGRQLADDTFADEGGSEAGIAHCFFDEAGARALLEGYAIDALAEQSAANTAGSWAHTPREAADIIHWFVRARRR